MKVYRFSTFTLHLGRYELAEGARPIALPRVAMEILILLVEHRGNLVSRQEIARRIWSASDPDDVVQSINTAVNRIRNALRDDLNKPVFIQTVIGKGYRFVAEIVETGGAGDDRRVTEEGLSSPVNKLALEQFQQWQNATPSVEVSVVEANGRAIVLALKGPLALSVGLKIAENQMQAALDRFGLVGTGLLRVVIDLTDVPYMDSAGLGLAMFLRGLILQQGGVLRLCGVSERVMSLLQMTKTDVLLNIDKTISTSLAVIAR